MMLRRVSISVLAFAALVGLGNASARANDMDTIQPFQMLRSLQFVQDTVVLGDHSAAEMQRFMLGTIDERLRSADQVIFDDPRNVDAALIYAMSGGNPATLEFLVARDINGNFDNRIADSLRKYLSGKGTLIAKSLGEISKEYRNTDLAPYLALVAGNVTITRDPVEALKFYDWARLTAPGTIVEEAALRRSLAVAVDAKIVDKAGGYANRYARRYLYSPYASQFADLFVQLVVEHYDVIKQEDIEATLGYMDNDRRREVYLRIARKAAIAGRKDLTKMAADQARALSGTAEGADALANLYGGLVNLSTDKVDDAMQAIMDIPAESLSPKDLALRRAAEAVAKEVLRKPEPVRESLTQANANTTDADTGAMASVDADSDLQDPTAPPTPASVPQPQPVSAEAAETNAANLDPAVRTFVDSGRTKLDAIDDLLKQEGP
ncbi:chemotaxis protein MotC [Rhizobium sp. CECT 9324]|uniref:chemotaxis protein MotC n=1 Tax=Rhizobium sp. CECT 9324 TaxID=2845820 RepID=UPI001E30C44A|nr:chemotaxis protein MotC [Rhizobium sp. CECT 9324]CAH0339498.1 hypothetical protein RHI9324_01147 [Rhizobium sp. CECT 9324]